MEGTVWIVAVAVGGGLGWFAFKHPEMFLEFMPPHLQRVLYAAFFVSGLAIGAVAASIVLLAQWPEGTPQPTFSAVDGPMWLLAHMVCAMAGLVFWVMTLAPIAGEIAKKSLKQ